MEYYKELYETTLNAYRIKYQEVMKTNKELAKTINALEEEIEDLNDEINHVLQEKNCAWSALEAVRELLKEVMPE